MQRSIITWLTAAVVTTIIFGTIYVSVQQSLRQSADDPQIQLAEDTARAIAGGAPASEFTKAKVDLANSLAPFLIIYDKDGRVISSSAELNGETPVLPSGALSDVDRFHQNRFTWQPAEGTRIASVVTAITNGNNTAGYVLAGRSLREVEKRESNLTLMVGSSWAMSLIVLGAGLLASLLLQRN